MNPGVPQCKNCWKWGHSTFSYRIQEAKCVKCNGLHKLKHHREFGWCCKGNTKLNPPRLETKTDKPCPHSFKCSNCKGDHQANSNSCPFWRHRFNREWHIKKYADVRIVEGGLCSFLFSLFYFSFFLYFLFLEQLRLGVISHAVTSVTI